MIYTNEPERRVLSNRDRDLFIALLERPPIPVDALRRAAQRHKLLIQNSE